MKRCLFVSVFCLALLIPTRAEAQKRIDDLIDQLSLVGEATYTSTIVRDPKTRRVRTKVRELTVSSAWKIGNKMKKAFREETKNATRSVEKQKDGVFQQWLTFETATQESVYRLKLGPENYLKVTIVVEVK